MLSELSEHLYSRDFSWKPNSLECLSSANVAEPFDFEFVSPAAEGRDGHTDPVMGLGTPLARAEWFNSCGTPGVNHARGCGRASEDGSGGKVEARQSEGRSVARRARLETRRGVAKNETNEPKMASTSDDGAHARALARSSSRFEGH